MKRAFKKIEHFVLRENIRRKRKSLRLEASPSSRKEVIWLFGPSSVGKKSLMFRLANSGGRHSLVAQTFGVGPADLVIPVVIPTRARGKSEVEVREVVSRRLRALRSVYESELDAKWIVHMQAIDLRENIAVRLINEFSEVRSKCFYLHVNESKYLERCKRGGISYGQAYLFKDTHMSILKGIFGGVTEIDF